MARPAIVQNPTTRITLADGDCSKAQKIEAEFLRGIGKTSLLADPAGEAAMKTVLKECSAQLGLRRRSSPNHLKRSGADSALKAAMDGLATTLNGSGKYSRSGR